MSFEAELRVRLQAQVNEALVEGAALLEQIEQAPQWITDRSTRPFMIERLAKWLKVERGITDDNEAVTLAVSGFIVTNKEKHADLMVKVETLQAAINRLPAPISIIRH